MSKWVVHVPVKESEKDNLIYDYDGEFTSGEFIAEACDKTIADQIVKEHNAINDLIGNGVITVKFDESKHLELMEEMSEKFSIYKPVILDQGNYEALKIATINLIDSLDIGAMTYPGVAEAVQKAKDAMK